MYTLGYDWLMPSPPLAGATKTSPGQSPSYVGRNTPRQNRDTAAATQWVMSTCHFSRVGRSRPRHYPVKSTRYCTMVHSTGRYSTLVPVCIASSRNLSSATTRTEQWTACREKILPPTSGRHPSTQRVIVYQHSMVICCVQRHRLQHCTNGAMLLQQVTIPDLVVD